MSGLSTRFVLLLISSLQPLFLACDDAKSEGRIVGTLEIPDCRDGKPRGFSCGDDFDAECTAFDLGADFYAFQVYDDNSATLRIQRGGSGFAVSDGLIMDIDDVRLLRGALEQPLNLGPADNIRAGLGLFNLCPDSTQNFELTGTVNFSHFGLEKGDRIRGELGRIEVRDGRGGRPGDFLGVITGYFDFTVQTGPPYQIFPQ